MDLSQALSALNEHTRHISPLYHLGTLNKAHKGPNSYEAENLSVSLYPLEWAEIADLNSEACWELSNPHSLFVDYYSLLKNPDLTELILSWGVEKGFLQPSLLYRVEYLDTSSEVKVFTLHRTQRGAQEELDAYDDDQLPSLSSFDGHILTPKAIDRAKHSHARDALCLDFAVMFFVADKTSYDGIYWEEDLSVEDYSAPRGCIFPSRLEGFACREVDTNSLEFELH